MSVVLPAPLGPKRPYMQCSGMSRHMRSKAVWSAYFFVTSLTDILVMFYRLRDHGTTGLRVVGSKVPKSRSPEVSKSIEIILYLTEKTSFLCCGIRLEVLGLCELLQQFLFLLVELLRNPNVHIDKHVATAVAVEDG